MAPSAVLREPWASDPARQHDDLKRLCAAQPGLCAALDLVEGIISENPNATKHKEAKAAIEILEGGHADLEGVLSDMAPTKCFNYVHEPHSSMNAEKFFDVVEIAEAVMGYLDVVDLLAVQQVNKYMLVLVDGSTKLQNSVRIPLDVTNVSRFADRIGHDLRIRCALRLPLYYIDFDEYDEQNNEIPQIRILCNAGQWYEDCKPGVRVRKLLVVSASFTKAYITVACCGESRTLYVPDGITLGDLYDAHIAAQKEQRLCPFAGTEMHDEKGEVSTSVSFSGHLPLELVEASRGATQHPMKRRAGREADELSVEGLARQRAEYEHRRLMSRYRMAKQYAFGTARDVPTLAEFKSNPAAYWEESDEEEGEGEEEDEDE